MIFRFRFWLIIILLSVLPLPGRAYSVLSHEALIDAAWDDNIRPVLLKRFPDATPDELRQAHGFAYGGAIIQDLGYYPHGSHFFTDLVHYVRSGDFIVQLIHDSRTLNEYAFAIGALAHYAADTKGHSIGVNRSVPLLYPKIRRTHDGVVTYEDDPPAHLKTEFGFDVLEVAKQRYAPDSYHDFIGFDVSKDLLERAFEETYSLSIRSLFDVDRTIGTYRWAVRSIIPKATKIAWVQKRNEIERDEPGITRRRFLYNLSRSSYEREWGGNYDHPGFGSRLLAFFITLIPKIGPLRALSFRLPTPQAEKLFMASFNAALDQYRGLLKQLGDGCLSLPNRNFDTGTPIEPGTYFMQSDAYARLLQHVAQDHFQQISPALRANLISYFSSLSTSDPTFHFPKTHVDWHNIPQEIEDLRAQNPGPEIVEVQDPGCRNQVALGTE